LIMFSAAHNIICTIKTDTERPGQLDLVNGTIAALGNKI